MIKKALKKHRKNSARSPKELSEHTVTVVQTQAFMMQLDPELTTEFVGYDNMERRVAKLQH